MRMAAWYERHAHPRVILTAIVLALYLPSLLQPPFIDDYRNLRLMAEFRDGRRASLDLYRFFTSDAGNQLERAAGRSPWWLSDHLRFAYKRPLTEWMLYGEYLLWGDRVALSRLVGIALYLASVMLLLSLMRMVQPDERLARWAALLFAIASSHAIPVTFVAARCDLLSLMMTLGCVKLGLRHAATGAMPLAVASAGCFIAALLSKEASLPAFVGLFIVAWCARALAPVFDQSAHRRRTNALCAVLGLIAVSYLWMHRSGDNVINVRVVLDPLARPLEYLIEAPQRMFVYLASWLVPANPAIFYYHSSGRGPMKIFMAVGAAALFAVGAVLLRLAPRDRAVLAFAAWPLPFIAILACALPDERLMMLPSIGLCYLAAAWLRAPLPPEGGGRWLLRRLPALLLIVAPVATTSLTIAAVYGLESRAAKDLRAIHADVQAAGAAAPRVFLINACQAIHALWAQDRADKVLGPSAMCIDALCDVPSVDVDVFDTHTLRLRCRRDAFFDTLLGHFALPAGQQVSEGMRFESEEFDVTAREVRDGHPQRFDLRFKRPLNDPGYYFVHIMNDQPPRRWIPQVGTRQSFRAFSDRD